MKNRESGPKIKKVGKGITEHERATSVFDEEHLQRTLQGALVHRDLITKPERPLSDVRRELELFCREAFASQDLPDPFSLIHPEGRFRSIPWADAIWKGTEYVREKHDLGFKLCALWHLAPEDHTDRWYAAKIALEFVRLDMTKAASGDDDRIKNIFVEVGIEIGRLETELKLKHDHETDALRGKKTIASAQQGGFTTAGKTKEGTQAVVDFMSKKISEGAKVSEAARWAKKAGLGVSAKANRQAYYRNR